MATPSLSLSLSPSPSNMFNQGLILSKTKLTVFGRRARHILERLELASSESRERSQWCDATVIEIPE